MKRNFVLVSALAAGLTTAAGVAQTATTPAPSAPATATAPVAPQAVPAKIALIEYEQATAATNEGQKAMQDLQAKYLPKKQQLSALQTEIESLTKQLQSAPATMSQDERDSRARTLDLKQKQLQRDGEDATAAFNSDMQEALGKVAQKLGPIVVKYVQQNGYTMLLDNTGQQGGLNIMWGGTDISQAVVDAYNASSGVAAPMPSAPAASHTTHPPATHPPASHTTTPKN
jgi:Skp family chaperone for outer membrane proteins